MWIGASGGVEPRSAMLIPCIVVVRLKRSRATSWMVSVELRRVLYASIPKRTPMATSQSLVTYRTAAPATASATTTRSAMVVRHENRNARHAPTTVMLLTVARPYGAALGLYRGWDPSLPHRSGALHGPRGGIL